MWLFSFANLHEFLGLIGLIDPVRESVPAAIGECYGAGIRVVMITGDYPATAQNIAQHKEFILTFTSFREEFERDGATAHLVVRIETELMRWLSGHIKRTDTQLAPCVKGKA